MAQKRKANLFWTFNYKLISIKLFPSWQYFPIHCLNQQKLWWIWYSEAFGGGDLLLLLICCCGCKKKARGPHTEVNWYNVGLFMTQLINQGHTGENTKSTRNSLPFQGMKDTRPFIIQSNTHLPKKPIQTNSLESKGKRSCLLIWGSQHWGHGERQGGDVQPVCWTWSNHQRTLVLSVGFILNLSPGPTLLLGSHATLNASSLQMLAWALHHRQASELWAKQVRAPAVRVLRTGVTYFKDIS